MDIKDIEGFFDYQPIYEEDPLTLLQDILEKAKKYLPAEKMEGITKAYLYTKNAHEGVKRLSGEPYIVHPLRATQFLMEIKPDLESIQACILHDVIEDTDITYDDIEKAFSKEVADICEGLVKVSKVRYQGEDRHLETIKKTFLAMAKDLRVIFIKLADRVHNIQTLQFHPEEKKRKKIAEETLKIYVPVAKRLGLYHFQLYLENGSFKVLNPEDFDIIMHYLKKYLKDGEKYTEKGKKMLTSLLKKEGISDFVVKGRLKSPYRIFEKLDKKYNTSDISTIMDLLAFRIITKSIGDCYMALGIVHKYYTPLIKKIKDYIAVPKFNGYKSIHTTILGMFRFPVEIQIRTQDMDDVAEYGVAAHFAYAENNQSVAVSDNQSQWIQKLQTIVASYTGASDKEKFKDALNIEVLEKSIFVYTPKGDIKELPRGSSVLDFAFYIHSDIGLRFKNAIVNGHIKPISYILKTGDIININTFKNRYSANKHWMDFLHTPTARAQLTKFIRTQERDVRLEEAIDGLNQYLQELGLPLFRSEKDMIQKMGDHLEVEKRILLVLDRQETYGSIVRSAYPNLLKNVAEKTVVQELSEEGKELQKSIGASPEQTLSMDVIVDNDKHLNCLFCPECKPTPPEKIIAKSGKFGIKIHQISCKALKTVSLDSLMEAHRKGQENAMYTFSAKLKFSNNKISIVDMITIFSQFNIPISKLSIKNTDDGGAILDVESEVENPAKISFLLSDLKKNHTSIDILKKVIE